MIDKSLRELVKGRIREFSREPSALIFVIFMPVIWICVLGLALSDNGAKPIYVAIVAEEKSTPKPFHENVVHALKEFPSKINVSETRMDEANTLLKRGSIWLVIKPRTKDRTIEYIYDAKHSEAARAYQLANDTIQSSFGRTNPIQTQVNPFKAPGARYVDFLIPGLLVFSLFTTSMFGTGMTIVSNRRENLLKRYLATPMNPYYYILSHIIGRSFIYVVETTVVLLTGMAIFGFVIQGSFGLFLLSNLIATACFTSIAILLAARNSNTATYNGMINFLTLPMMIFGGVWFARDHLPGWMNQIATYLPMTLGVDSARKIAIESATLVQVWPQLVLLLSYTAVFTVLAKMRFRWFS